MVTHAFLHFVVRIPQTTAWRESIQYNAKNMRTRDFGLLSIDHPAFLVIGAMKAGTTTLFHDLEQNRAICFPKKEPAYLTRYDVPGAVTAYRELFRRVEPGQIVGEGSTGYSMLPRFTGVAEKALACFGQDLKILYLVRNPIQRALSHHYHSMSYGLAHVDPDIALHEDPDFLSTSRYAMQLDTWRAVFPAAQVRVVIAEEYYASRQATIGEICNFLGVPDIAVDESARHNLGEERRVGRWNVVRRAHWYRRYIAPQIPAAIRDRASRLLLSPGPPRPRLPNFDSLQRLRDALEPEVEALTRFMGRATAPWNLTDTVRRMADRASA